MYELPNSVVQFLTTATQCKKAVYQGGFLYDITPKKAPKFGASPIGVLIYPFLFSRLQTLFHIVPD